MMRLTVTASSLVYSHSLRDLYVRLGETGWSLKKVKFDKKEDCYVASAKNPYGEELEGTGPDEAMAVRNLLLKVERKNHMRSAAMERVGMWKSDWADQLQPIAEAYAKAPVYDPKAAAAFKALADDSQRRADVLRNQLEIEETNDPEPYPHAQAQADDIHKRQHYTVSRANCDHPIWTPEQNVNFRIVHDVLGHAVSGGDFGWEGENAACRAHFPLLSEEAQKALFTECLSQTAYAAHYRHFGPQKVALFPQFYEPVQRAEGVRPGFQGIHPSQSIAPTAMPAIKPSKPVGLPKDNVAPHEQEAMGLPVQMNYVPGVDKRIGAAEPGRTFDPTLADPNKGYQTGISAMEPNGYLHHGDPLEAEDAMRNASLIDTEWATLKTGDNKPDYERMKLAIINAFRAVILSPRKNLRWNTIHYQDISHVPPGVSDPVVYYNALENKRQAWNVKNFGEGGRFKHKPWYKLVPQFEMAIYQRNPQAGWEAAKERAQREMFDWEQEAQERVMEADRDLPEEKQMRSYEVEYEANKILVKDIEAFLKEYQPSLDHPSFEGRTGAAKAPTQEDTLFPLEPPSQEEIPDRSSYAAFFNSQAKSLAQISAYADELLKAALEDVHEHDGSGHHFRSAVLQLDIPSVGPKVASFAWLLLQPTTSQLATIDTHIMDVLGHNFQKDMNDRDFFKFERELQTGRDAAGYGHVPLGAFQWAIWDYKRTGEGSHQDHSGLRVLDPVPHDSIDWKAKEQSLKGDAWHAQGPDWWKNTAPARKQVGEEWDEQITSPKNQVPYQVISSFAKTAITLRTPWFQHPQSGERIVGLPGQTLMAHIVEQTHLSTPAIWAQVGDNAAGKS
jgi:hypothetical protein